MADASTLITDIKLESIDSCVVSNVAQLNTGIVLLSDTLVIDVQANSNLLTEIPIDSNVTSVVEISSPELITEIHLDATLVSNVNVVANVRLPRINLEANTLIVNAAILDNLVITTNITVEANVAAVSLATAELTTEIHLGAEDSCIVANLAQLNTGIVLLSDTLITEVSSLADISTSIELTKHLAISAISVSNLSTAIYLDSHISANNACSVLLADLLTRKDYGQELKILIINNNVDTLINVDMNSVLVETGTNRNILIKTKSKDTLIETKLI